MKDDIKESGLDHGVWMVSFQKRDYHENTT